MANSQHCIALLTDYGYQDAYAGLLKAVIYNQNPVATIIDLTHGISKHDILSAAMQLFHSYRFFPRGTIFLCVVDPTVGSSRAILCAKSESYFFIAPDNGLLTMVANHETLDLRIIPTPKRNVSATFHGRDIMAPVAASLSKSGRFFYRLKQTRAEITKIHVPEPTRLPNGLKGEIVYYDDFGNAWTNIQRHHIQGRVLSLIVTRPGRKIQFPFVAYYSMADRYASILNSSNHLELARVSASLKNDLKLPIGTEVHVKYEK